MPRSKVSSGDLFVFRFHWFFLLHILTIIEITEKQRKQSFQEQHKTASSWDDMIKLLHFKKPHEIIGIGILACFKLVILTQV